MNKITFVTIMIFFVSSFAQALPSHQFIGLGNLSGAGTSTAYSINSYNQIAGSAFDGLGNDREFIGKIIHLRNLRR